MKKWKLKYENHVPFYELMSTYIFYWDKWLNYSFIIVLIFLAASVLHKTAPTWVLSLWWKALRGKLEAFSQRHRDSCSLQNTSPPTQKSQKSQWRDSCEIILNQYNMRMFLFHGILGITSTSRRCSGNFAVVVMCIHLWFIAINSVGLVAAAPPHRSPAVTEKESGV